MRSDKSSGSHRLFDSSRAPTAIPQRAPIAKAKLDQYWTTTGPFGVMFRNALRTLQFTFAVTVAGLYGPDLVHATSAHHHANPSWVYAEVVACLSALTCIIHCFVTVKRVAWTFWDWVLAVLWAAHFGVFASIYLPRNGEHSAGAEDLTTSAQRMKAGIWMGIISTILWLVTGVMGVVWCCAARRFTRKTDNILEAEETLVRRGSRGEGMNEGSLINGKIEEKQ